MTEPSQTQLTARFTKAKLRVQTLLHNEALSFLSLEGALQGLTLEQRLEIKRGLAKAGRMP